MHTILLFLLVSSYATVPTHPAGPTTYLACPTTHPAGPGLPADSTYKSWYYTPTGVYGRIALAKTNNRSYVRISKTNDQLVSVLEYNPAGIMIKTTRIQFLQGRLSLITATNRWGAIIDSMWFKPDGADDLTAGGNDKQAGVAEFIVTQKTAGQNPYLPCKAVRFTFKHNLLLEMLCLSDSTKPGFDQEGVSHYVFERYDDPARFGLIKTESYFSDIDIPLMSNRSDCHKLVMEYNGAGDLISRSVYGLKDEPIVNREGVFKTTMTYDKEGNQTLISYLDATGAPNNDYLGYARMEKEYKKGLLTTTTCYTASYMITRPTRVADSVPIVQYKYNENGDETTRTYHDADYTPLDDPQGIHKQIIGYTPSGMISELSYFDKKDRPAVDGSGVHKYIFERNSKGQLIKETALNWLGVGMQSMGEGIYMTIYRCDDWGRIISLSYWLNDTVKMENRSGIHESRASYDTAGRLAELEFLGEDGGPASGKSGYSKQKLTYNAQSQLEQRTFFIGEDPVMLKPSTYLGFHYHSIKYNYDFYNRVRSVEYADESGKPVDAQLGLNNTTLQCHRVEFNYQGAEVGSEAFYPLADDTTAPVTLDCLTMNCLTPSAVTIKVRHLTVRRDSARAPAAAPLATSATGTANATLAKMRRTILPDSLFFSHEIGFIDQDTLLFFLQENRPYLSEEGCATVYRIAPINKYYQITGTVSDHYLENDTLAAQLTFALGKMDGPCTYYYKNGKIKESGEYKENKKIGLWDYFYETGAKSKSINFTNKGSRLIECYGPDGAVLARDGNGRFEGKVMLGTSRSSIPYTIKGPIRNGQPDGDWMLSNQFINGPSNIETFSSGKFLSGTSYSLALGKTEYSDKSYSNYESTQSDEHLDHYGQNDYCSIAGAHRAGLTLTFDDNYFFPQIRKEMTHILRSNKYKDYSGWVFLDIRYNEQGKVSGKYVRLCRPNDPFRDELLKMLGGIGDRPPHLVNALPEPFERFYVVLVEANQLVIPEELLKFPTAVRRQR